MRSRFGVRCRRWPHSGCSRAPARQLSGGFRGGLYSFRARRPPTVTRDQRRVLASVVRIVVMTTVLFVLYARVPLGTRPDAAVGLELAILLVAFTAVLGWQIRAITRSSHPGLRAMEVVGTGVPV